VQIDIQTSTRLVGVNENGRRVGDFHPNAKLSDGDVELLLEMREEGWGYRRLAAKFEVSKNLVRMICAGKRRCSRVERLKRVELNPRPRIVKPRGRPKAAPKPAAEHPWRNWVL
jgi:hypothetical protein